MALVLTQAQRDRISFLIGRFDLSGGPGGPGMDERTAQELYKIFGQECGFTCGCPGTLLEGLRDNPTSTLLKLLVCGTEGLVAPADIPEVIDPGTPPDLFGDGPDAPNMLTTCGYGLLAGSTITNTGATVITGDLGLWPGTSVTGFPPGVVIGTQHITDAAAQQAQADLTALYNDLQGRTGATQLPGQIGGTTQFPGVYASGSSFLISSGDLTLDGNGNANSVFIFQAPSTLTVNSGRNIILTNGTQARNVFFAVGSSATIGTDSIFQGNIVALTSITINTGATVIGRALTRNAAVTLEDNAVVSPGC